MINFLGIITVNRPDALNALNAELIEELTDAVNSMINNEDVGVVILTGSGEKSFIAGADIKKMQTMIWEIMNPCFYPKRKKLFFDVIS